MTTPKVKAKKCFLKMLSLVESLTHIDWKSESNSWLEDIAENMVQAFSICCLLLLKEMQPYKGS